MFKLNQFSHADQLVLNTARSVGYRVALVVTLTIDGKILHSAQAIGHRADLFQHPSSGYEAVPLEAIEGL